MSAYQGLVTGQTGILLPRLNYIKIATLGFPFTNVSGSFESMKIPLRGVDGILDYKSVEINDVTKAPNVQMFEVTITIPVIYGGNDLTQNLMLLSQDRCQVLIADLSATPNFYNFVAPAGTYAAPTGTDFMAVGYKVSLPFKGDQKTDIILKTQLTDTELNELMVLVATAQTGGASGTTNGLVSITTPGNIQRPGWKSITVNAVSVGELQDASLEITNVPIIGNKGKEYSRSCTVLLKASTIQVNPTNIKGFIDNTQQRYAVVGNRYNDDVWTWTSGLRVKTPGISHGDKPGVMQLEWTAEYLYDFTNSITFPTLATPTFVQLGL